MSCYTFDGGREIFGRYVQPLGIVAHITFRSAYSSCKQSHQLFNDVGCAVSMGICGITLGRHWYHNQVVFDNVIAMLIKYKTCLTCQAKQMHAGVAQLIGIHPVEVCGILKI